MIMNMNTTLYFYTHLDCEELQIVLDKHQAWLDDELHRLYDLVDDDQQGASDLKKIDLWADELGAPEVHPIHDELSFDDLTFDGSSIELTAQKQFFAGCRSSLVWQHLADFHTNPLQVSAVKNFCENLPEILIDGDIDDCLYFGEEFRAKLASQFIDSQVAILKNHKKDQRPKIIAVCDDNPIQLRLKKIRQKLKELSSLEKQKVRDDFVSKWPDLDRLFRGIEENKEQNELRIFSGLAPKSFTDGIERIFLFLK